MLGKRPNFNIFPANTLNRLGGYTNSNTVIRQGIRDYSTSTDDHIVPNGNARANRYPHPTPNTIPNCN